VVVDRVRRHVQLACDLTIREAFGDQLCHRAFGVGQASPARGRTALVLVRRIRCSRSAESEC
jgi:hypothetical protein